MLRVFQPDIQYVVPIFQRRYVWNEEDQWADLWEDLLETMRLVAEAQRVQEDGVDVPARPTSWEQSSLTSPYQQDQRSIAGP